jgi:hypothetical protein
MTNAHKRNLWLSLSPWAVLGSLAVQKKSLALLVSLGCSGQLGRIGAGEHDPTSG